jgi:hypothetical protein
MQVMQVMYSHMKKSKEAFGYIDEKKIFTKKS